MNWTERVGISPGVWEDWIIVAQYRAEISHHLLKSSFELNPDVEFSLLREAVDREEPRGLLPSPWPPCDTGGVRGLTLAALRKFSAVLSITYRSEAKAKHLLITGKISETASAAELKAQIGLDFYQVSAEFETSPAARFSFEARLHLDGGIRQSFQAFENADLAYRDGRSCWGMFSCYLTATALADTRGRIEAISGQGSGR